MINKNKFLLKAQGKSSCVTYLFGYIERASKCMNIERRNQLFLIHRRPKNMCIKELSMDT